MRPRIAIPMPHSSDRDYGERAIPQYERAVIIAGGEPVRIELNQNAVAMRNATKSCDAVLLPGSNADVDPRKFGQERSAYTAEADSLREESDFLLLEDAYTAGKPILGICYGLQSLNVFLGGSLIQHIPNFLPPESVGKVNHEAGRNVAIAHSVEVSCGSLLAGIIGNKKEMRTQCDEIVVPVNSSHHQSADAIGSGLRIVARCPDDGIIEAMEGTSENHFVMAVQWHPERSIEDDEQSPGIFRALINAIR